MVLAKKYEDVFSFAKRVVAMVYIAGILSMAWLGWLENWGVIQREWNNSIQAGKDPIMILLPSYLIVSFMSGLVASALLYIFAVDVPLKKRLLVSLLCAVFAFPIVLGVMGFTDENEFLVGFLIGITPLVYFLTKYGMDLWQYFSQKQQCSG